MPSFTNADLPFNLKEFFNCEAKGRATALRAKARGIFVTDHDTTEFLISKNRFLGGGIPLDMSTKSDESHQLVMDYLTRLEYNVYT
ncbi:MAG: hypothetical protein JWO78_1609 [Micavibrio sp.]|nr:hypothetical protein [Micavibrio sp.]